MTHPTDGQIEKVVAELRRRAMTGFAEGQFTPYMELCRMVAFGTSLLLTRDVGYHTSGWWKNPDYERCWHFSMAPAPSEVWMPSTPELNKKLKARWLKAVFGDNLKLTWVEPPHTNRGRQIDVWHWRLFCDENWQPMKPRGEVYSKEFTEVGWKSFSEVNAKLAGGTEGC